MKLVYSASRTPILVATAAGGGQQWKSGATARRRQASAHPTASPVTPAATPIYIAPAPSRVIAGAVTFAPGARTHWHTHPFGQLLIVTAGAGPTTGMSHIAVNEAQDGSAVGWLEPVADDQYLG